MLFNCINNVLVLLCTICVYGQEVKTKFGRIRGNQNSLEDGTVLYEFLGIPYAVKPVGKLRFKDPIHLTDKFSNEPFEATQPTKCVQVVPTVWKVVGEEDCLHLNIYTTKLDSKANFDVLVFIHGGAFTHGAGYTQSPEYLYQHNKDFVFVSINYRLGPFGFLSTGDNVVPGNMGLKDQVVALEWIHENIHNFGGNRNNIVLAGMSAGGISVHLHYLSPLSRDLFVRGISMSGTALNSLMQTKSIKENFKHFAELFPNCMKKWSTKKVVECLSTEISVNEILEKLTDISREQWEEYSTCIYFGIVIEKGGPKPFLDQHPFHLLRKGKVKQAPWLISATTSEGLYPSALFVDDSEKMRVVEENWNSIAPHLLCFKDFCKEKQIPKISELIKKHYLGEKPVSIENREDLIRMVGDRVFMTKIENSLRLHAAASRASVYMYLFDYRGKQSFSSLLSKTDSNLGVSHIDDLIYLFKIQRFKRDDEDQRIYDIMAEIWHSFMKNGIPDTGTGVSWPVVSNRISYVGNIDYMLIGQDGPKVESKIEISDKFFWDTLPLDELHVSGDLRVPKHIRNLQKHSWWPSKDEMKLNVMIARLQRKNPFAYFLKKKILLNSLSNRGK